MAYPVASGSVLQLTLRGILLDQVVMTIFHYQLDPTSPSLLDGAAALDNFFTQIAAGGDMLNDYGDAMPTEWVSDEIDLQWIWTPRYVKKTYANPFPNGNSGSSTTVCNLACAMEIRGETANKRSVGIKHLPGVGGGDATAGFLTPAYLATAAAIKAQCQASVVAAGRTYNPIIYGRERQAFTKCGKTYPFLPQLSTRITNASLNDTVRVMRRRTVGIGI